MKTIATLFNITRIYNACCAVGYMRRGLALAKSYAHKRKAFGKNLINHGLHVVTLSDLQVRFEACFQLTFHTVSLLGKEELGKTTAAESASLRLLIPLIKLFTAKEGLSIASEVLESFGGAGYVEDTGLPQLLRNAQVLSIWEGTTNVLSLDVLRAIKKDGAGLPFIQDISERAQSITRPDLSDLKVIVLNSVQELDSLLSNSDKLSEEELNSSSRSLAFSLASTYAAALLLHQAQWEEEQGVGKRASHVARHWIEGHLLSPSILSTDHIMKAREILG